MQRVDARDGIDDVGAADEQRGGTRGRAGEGRCAHAGWGSRIRDGLSSRVPASSS